LVEGYTDVIQFNQAGIENVVASSGTALTPEQIRLINRLTKNITVLYDGDAAGLRASIRGIDLILEEGMNVRVCTFPEGEDPDSFAKKATHEELIKYLDENAKDFIQFKASLLMDEAKNDPIKKADLIRDMVVSISKIKDRIQREIYIQECSRIMDISEQVLLNTLAQLLQKDISEAGKKLKQEQKYFEVVKNEETIATEKVDVLNLLEKKILEILLIYGNFEIEFENVFIKYEDEKEVQVTEKVTTKIFNRIYLNLQEDEIQFANPIFKDIYDDLIANYLNNDIFDSENYLNNLKPEFLPVVTDIYMDDEKHQLHGWLEKKQVFVKDKFNSEVLKSLVVDVIISYREYLINKLNSEQMIEILKPEIEDKTEILSSINDYNKLKVVISRSIGRIRPSSFLLNDF
jgi:DNA primase